jgi:NAD-dependent dihydropyrimidine dehydrogenase PreA subunit
MIREIIQIDENKCNGCGNCIPNCHEGALQIIDNKAVLISDLMCDGLGACLGHCPEGALTIGKKEAGPYNEAMVMKQMVKKGKNVVIAHLKHLKEHDEREFLKEGVRFLWENKELLDFNPAEVVEKVHGLKPVYTVYQPVQHTTHAHACPGSTSKVFSQNTTPSQPDVPNVSIGSALTHWPVQLHLINPDAVYFQNADLLVAADCTAFSNGDFHRTFLKNRKLVIACPKLDKGMDIYLQKLIRLINDAKINTITVIRMEVPCCGGLVQLVSESVSRSGRKVPVKEIVLSVEGGVLSEVWVVNRPWSIDHC